MKHLGSLIPRVVACGAALVVSAMLGTAQAQSEGTATVRAIRGSAQYSDAGGGWMALKVGKILKSGALVKTAANSQVDLYLKQNGPVVRVTADTTLGLDKLLFDDTGADTVIETQLNLQNGRILGNVKKLAAASRYEVKVPTGTVGIRGTEYDISASGVVHIISGEALVSYKSPTTGEVTTLTVKAGEWFVPPTDPQGKPTVQATPPVGWEPLPLPPIPSEIITPEGGVVIVQPVELPVSPIRGVAGPGGPGGPQGGPTGPQGNQTPGNQTPPGNPVLTTPPQ